MTEAEASSPGAAWYEDLGAEALQGDILLGIDVVRPSEFEGARYTFATKKANVAVLTQSCDIPKNAQHSLLLAEVHSYADLVNAGLSHLRESEYRLALQRGTAISDFLLPPSPDGRLDWSIISFRDLYVLPKVSVLERRSTASALSLASPYREYLSQAFARFVMRVGLPAGLSEFSKVT